MKKFTKRTLSLFAALVIGATTVTIPASALETSNMSIVYTKESNLAEITEIYDQNQVRSLK